MYAEWELVYADWMARRRRARRVIEQLKPLCRQIIEEELQRTKPPTNPDLDRAHAILEDFARCEDAEPNPAERRKLLLLLFAQVWAKDNKIVAVKPKPAFANYFTAASGGAGHAPKSRREQ